MTSVSGEAWFTDPALVRVLALLNSDGGEGRVAGGRIGEVSWDIACLLGSR